MRDIGAVAHLPQPISEAPQQQTPARTREAAAQFEALLIAQMLKSAREASGGLSGMETDEASSSAMAMAEEQLAQVLAAGGGLGLARLIAGGLESGPAGQSEGRAATAPIPGASR